LALLTVPYVPDEFDEFLTFFNSYANLYCSGKLKKQAKQGGRTMMDKIIEGLIREQKPVNLTVDLNLGCEEGDFFISANATFIHRDRDKILGLARLCQRVNLSIIIIPCPTASTQLGTVCPLPEVARKADRDARRARISEEVLLGLIKKALKRGLIIDERKRLAVECLTPEEHVFSVVLKKDI